MAYHGGALEEATDVVARAAAELAGASYYGVHQPNGMGHHAIDADPTRGVRSVARFLRHIDVVVTIHGYGGAASSRRCCSAAATAGSPTMSPDTSDRSCPSTTSSPSSSASRPTYGACTPPTR